MSDPTAYRYRHNSWPDWHYITVSEAEGEYAPDRLRQLFDQSEPLYTDPDPDDREGLVEAARDAMKYMGHLPTCDFGNDTPDGDFCTCKFAEAKRALRDHLRDAPSEERVPVEEYEGDPTSLEQIREGVERWIYYRTNLDPHDDEAWLVDSLMKDIRRLLYDPYATVSGERPGGSGEEVWTEGCPPTVTPDGWRIECSDCGDVGIYGSRQATLNRCPSCGESSTDLTKTPMRRLRRSTPDGEDPPRLSDGSIPDTAYWEDYYDYAVFIKDGALVIESGAIEGGSLECSDRRELRIIRALIDRVLAPTPDQEETVQDGP